MTQYLLFGHDQRDLLHVLHCCAQQALLEDLLQSPSPGIPIAMEFLRVGKATFDGLLPSTIDFFPCIGVAMAVVPVLAILPDVPRHDLCAICRSCAAIPDGAGRAVVSIGDVVAVAMSIGGAVNQGFALGT
jgi:hypothetical protein